MVTELDPTRAVTQPSLRDPGGRRPVQRTTAALEANGITVLRARDAAEAKRIVLDLIPDGSQVHHGASQTLEVTGHHRGDREVRPLRPDPPTDPEHGSRDPGRRDPPADRRAGRDARQRPRGHRDRIAARRLDGRQPAGPYAAGAGRVILVVGTQKIVADLEEGLRRIDEYAFPLEDARAQAAYGIHSGVNKILIINREIVPGRITVVLVDEALGF